MATANVWTAVIAFISLMGVAWPGVLAYLNSRKVLAAVKVKDAKIDGLEQEFAGFRLTQENGVMKLDGRLEQLLQRTAGEAEERGKNLGNIQGRADMALEQSAQALALATAAAEALKLPIAEAKPGPKPEA
jgi:hypothetical protein